MAGVSFGGDVTTDLDYAFHWMYSDVQGLQFESQRGPVQQSVTLVRELKFVRFFIQNSTQSLTNKT